MAEKGLETLQLQFILDNSTWMKPFHIKVCAKDLLPRRNPQHVRAYIVNTDNNNQPGQHWVALFFNGREAIYFDSYGNPPLQPIMTFMENNAERWKMNTLQLQSAFSNVCGHYCVFILLHLVRGLSLHTIIRRYFDSSNHHQNDLTVKRWFKNQYGTVYKHVFNPNMNYGQCCKPKVASHALSVQFPMYNVCL